MSSRRLSRRTVLRGIGAAVSLPFLESLSFANVGRPLRLAFLCVPNGVNMSRWTPKAEGPLGELPPTLAPLEAVKDQVLVLSGLTHAKARANGDGPGDHARAAATFLTGAQARKTDGRDIRVGVSVDQVAAGRLGPGTRLPSLEVGCDRSALAGNCDSGYSCAYSSNISWRTANMPTGKLVTPREVLHRLFGDDEASLTDQERARRAADASSVLDLVAADAKSVRASLGRADQAKLDEYLDAVRSVEQRVQDAAKETRAVERPAVPEGIPPHPEHVRLMCDLIALAFRTDTTRVASFLLANEGSDRTFPFLEVRDGHHTLSHHGNEPEKLDKVARIDRFYVGAFAYLLEKLKATPDGDGPLLDNCMLVYGSAIGDGNAHNHERLPVLLAGRGGGSLATGRHLRFAAETPMCNLYLSLLDRCGLRLERFGDSTGRLNDL